MRSFLIVTAVAVATVALAALGLGVSVWGVLTTRSAILVVAAAAAASTSGWLIVLKGLEADPGRFVAFFGAGLAAKALVLATTGVLVVGTGLAGLDEFVIGTMVCFLVLNFAQLIPVTAAIGAAGRAKA